VEYLLRLLHELIGNGFRFTIVVFSCYCYFDIIWFIRNCWAASWNWNTI